MKMPPASSGPTCLTCKHCSVDYDKELSCVHPNVLEFHRHGVNLNKAITAFCGEDLKLREEREST
jgi:predicted metal-binding protein